MRTSIFKCEAVTPMLSRSMNKKKENSWKFELRPQSVKGVMRFWFRALVPCVIDPDWYEGEHKKFEGLHRLESMIFGSQGEKSPFSLSVTYDDSDEPVDNLTKDQTLRNSLFGTFQMGKGDTSPSFSFLKPGSTFTIKITYSKKVPEVQKDLTDSLISFISNYGGFGAKARDGYGSFRIVAGRGFEKKDFLNQPSRSKELLSLYIKELSKDLVPSKEIIDLTPYDFPTLAISREKVAFVNSDDWRIIIRELTGRRTKDGEPISRYSELKLNELRKYNEADDNLNPLRKAFFEHMAPSKEFVLRTSIMGLPIIYQNVGQRPNTTGKAIITVSNSDDGTGRKASPLFISIHKAVNNSYFARILLMASKISPERDSRDRPVIYAKVGSKSYPILGNENFEELWNLIEGVI